MARLQMKLTQKELAACVGLHSDTIYLLEKNKAKVNVKYIILLENYLKCNLCSYDGYYQFASNTSSNIKLIRVQLKFTQRELAAKLGISIGTLVKWECGCSHITRKHYNFILRINK